MSWFTDIADKVQEQAGLYADQAAQAYAEFQDYRENNLKERAAEGNTWSGWANNKIDQVQEHFSEEEMAKRAAEERQMNYFQANPSKQALGDKFVDMLGAGLMVSNALPKLAARVVPKELQALTGNITNGTRLPAGVEEMQQLALARKLGQQQTNRQFAQAGLNNQATIDLGIKSAKMKAGLPQQKQYMRNVIAEAEDPAKTAALQKYWGEGMAQQKLDMREAIANSRR